MLCEYCRHRFNGCGHAVICARVCKLRIKISFCFRLQSRKVCIFVKYEYHFAYVTGHTAFNRVFRVKLVNEVFLDFVKLRLIYVSVEGNRQGFLILHCESLIETKQRTYNNRCRQYDGNDYRPKRRLFNRFREKLTHRRHPPLQGGNTYTCPCLRKGTIR